MVALMKMSESALRWPRVYGRVVDWVDWLARVSEEEDGVDEDEDGREVSGNGKAVSSGESVGRVARGDCGRPTGLGCVNDCIFGFV
jgi:hypothetical protein